MIGVAVVLFLVEFVIDKIALVDTAWDSVHTFIRPAVGGYLMSTATDTELAVPALAVSGVLLALSSHSAKASTRLVVNTSPEPVSNVAVSLGEDGLVFAVMALAISRPEVAVAVVALLTIASVVVAFVFYRIARRVARRVRMRLGERRSIAIRNRVPEHLPLVRSDQFLGSGGGSRPDRPRAYQWSCRRVHTWLRPRRARRAGSAPRSAPR